MWIWNRCDDRMSEVANLSALWWFGFLCVSSQPTPQKGGAVWVILIFIFIFIFIYCAPWLRGLFVVFCWFLVLRLLHFSRRPTATQTSMKSACWNCPLPQRSILESETSPSCLSSAEMIDLFPFFPFFKRESWVIYKLCGVLASQRGLAQDNMAAACWLHTDWSPCPGIHLESLRSATPHLPTPASKLLHSLSFSFSVSLSYSLSLSLSDHSTLWSIPAVLHHYSPDRTAIQQC